MDHLGKETLPRSTLNTIVSQESTTKQHVSSSSSSSTRIAHRLVRSPGRPSEVFRPCSGSGKTKRGFPASLVKRQWTVELEANSKTARTWNFNHVTTFGKFWNFYLLNLFWANDPLNIIGKLLRAETHEQTGRRRGHRLLWPPVGRLERTGRTSGKVVAERVIPRVGDQLPLDASSSSLLITLWHMAAVGAVGYLWKFEEPFPKCVNHHDGWSDGRSTDHYLDHQVLWCLFSGHDVNPGAG